MRHLRTPVLRLAILALMQLPALAATSAPDVEVSVLPQLPLSSGTVDPALDLAEEDPTGQDLVLAEWTEAGTPGIVRRPCR